VSDEPDNTDMTPAEFRAAMANSIPVEVVSDPERIRALRAHYASTDTSADMDEGHWEVGDDWLLAEVARRIARDSGVRYELSDVLRELDLTVDDLEPDTPQRLWVLTNGNWSSNRTARYGAKGAPLAFLAGDEFGNRTACLRLPGKRLLVLNLAWPMSRELWEPTEGDL
jgi:hypothetical protein